MPGSETKHAFANVMPGSGVYFVSDATLEVGDAAIAVFTARLNGPKGQPVWVRAWLSNEAGTLAEIASDELSAGDEVRLGLRLPESARPEFAYMRIESAPMKTEHVVGLRLT